MRENGTWTLQGKKEVEGTSIRSFFGEKRRCAAFLKEKAAHRRFQTSFYQEGTQLKRFWVLVGRPEYPESIRFNWGKKGET